MCVYLSEWLLVECDPAVEKKKSMQLHCVSASSLPQSCTILQPVSLKVNVRVLDLHLTATVRTGDSPILSMDRRGQ